LSIGCFGEFSRHIGGHILYFNLDTHQYINATDTAAISNIFAEITMALLNPLYGHILGRYSLFFSD